MDKHWSSPDGIRQGLQEKRGVYAEYAQMLQNDAPAAVVANHNAGLADSEHWVRGYLFFLQKYGLSPRSIADVGCGAGFMAEVFRRFCPQATVTGYEASEEAVRYAQQHFNGRYIAQVIETNACLWGGL